MSPFIRHYLSLATLHSLVKTSYNFDIDLERVRGDFNKVSGKLNAFVRDAISQNSSPVIPPVRDFDAPASPTIQTTVKRKGKGPLTDQEIEDAIGDLFDYFNVTFATLMQNLSTEGMSSTRHAKGADGVRSVGLGDCAIVERHPFDDRGAACAPHVGTTNGDEAALREGGRHRLQVARGPFSLSSASSLPSDSLWVVPGQLFPFGGRWRAARGPQERQVSRTQRSSNVLRLVHRSTHGGSR